MALNNQFKVKNDLNTLGRILSGGVDIASIFAGSNTTWTVSAGNASFLIAGGDTLQVQGGNGVDVKVGTGTDTLVISGTNATTSARGVASFSSDNFTVTSGAVAIKDSGITDTKLTTISSTGKVANTATTATTANNPNTIVLRNNSGGFSAGTISVTGNVVATQTIAAPTLSTTGGTSTQWNSVYTTVNTNSSNYIIDGGNTKGSNLLIGTNDNFNLSFETNGTPRMTVTNTGTVAVAGPLSSSNVVYASGGNSNQWNTAFNTSTAYQAVSSSFATNTGVAAATATLLPTSIYRSASGNWQSTYTTVQNTSANWQSTYTTVQNNSSTTWNYQGTDLKNLSGSWQSTYTTVQNTSANWNSAYNVATTYQIASGGFALSGYNTTVDDAVSSVLVGGAQPQAASEWKKLSLVQVFDTILFPTLTASYVVPTLTIGSGQATQVEVGESITPTLTGTFTKHDAGRLSAISLQRNVPTAWVTLSTITNPVSTSTTDIPSQFGYSSPNNPNALYRIVLTDTTVLCAIDGTISWRAGSADYFSGLPKQNNKGELDTRPFAVRTTGAPQLSSAGTFFSSTFTVTGRRKLFFSNDNVATAPANSTQVRALTGVRGSGSTWPADGTVFDITINDGSTRTVVAYPTAFGLLQSVLDLDSQLSVTQEYTNGLTTVLVSGANGLFPVNYYVYTYISLGPLGATTHRVTI